MNGLGLFVLGSLVAIFLLRRVAELLSLRALRRPVPPDLAHLYPPELYARVQGYAARRTRLSLLGSSVELLLLLLFWFAGGFGVLDEAVRTATSSPLLAGLLFLGLLALAGELASLPFQVWSVFWIEEEYGFNRTTIGTFLLDHLKSWALGAVLGGVLLALLLELFLRLGPSAWLVCWGGVILLLPLLQLVVPRLVLPLFHRFTSLPAGELRDAIADYAARQRFPLADIHVVDGSRRTSRANAFFTGFGQTRRVALFDTLLTGHSLPEVVAVLAHEIGHSRRGHQLKGMLLAMVQTGLLLFLLSLIVESRPLAEAFWLSGPSVHAGFALFGLLFSPLELLLGIGLRWLSRRWEFEADRFAAETTGSPAPLLATLEKLAASGLNHPAPHPLLVLLTSSHPPLGPRLAALRRLPSTSAPA